MALVGTTGPQATAEHWVAGSGGHPYQASPYNRHWAPSGTPPACQALAGTGHPYQVPILHGSANHLVAACIQDYWVAPGTKLVLSVFIHHRSNMLPKLHASWSRVWD